jgi:cardiolipin synthase C
VAIQLEAIFDQESSAERAWAVTLENGKLRWSDGRQIYYDSPEASGGQKFQAWLAKVLPLDAQL